MRRHFVVFGVLVVMLLGLLATTIPASASVSGRQATAALLTGGALYELSRGHTGAGLLLGAGAAIAWNRANEERQERYGYYYPSQYYYAYPPPYYGSVVYLTPGFTFFGDRDDHRFRRDRDDRGHRDRDDWSRGHGDWDRR